MAKRETIDEPRWRIHVLRPDGSVRYGANYDCGFKARAVFDGLDLKPGERAEYQIRHAGKSRFVTFGWRP